MLMTKRQDMVFIVDELERSLHPKLTEHFLKLFMEAHIDSRMQLICTTHEDTIMDQELFLREHSRKLQAMQKRHFFDSKGACCKQKRFDIIKISISIKVDV